MTVKQHYKILWQSAIIAGAHVLLCSVIASDHIDTITVIPPHTTTLPPLPSHTTTLPDTMTLPELPTDTTDGQPICYIYNRTHYLCACPTLAKLKESFHMSVTLQLAFVAQL